MFTSEFLGPHHRIAKFACGKEELDHWLVSAAPGCQSSRTARTYVWADDANDIAAYFSLAPTAVLRDALPPSVGRGSPDPVPGCLIAKLALRGDLHGRRLGRVLLVDALGTAVEASAVADGRVVVVDAIDARALAFYERCDFRRLAADSNRLAMKMSTAVRLLASA